MKIQQCGKVHHTSAELRAMYEGIVALRHAVGPKHGWDYDAMNNDPDVAPMLEKHERLVQQYERAHRDRCPYD